VGVPPEIPGFGSTATILRVAPGFDPLKAGIGPDEYFVLSRIDGHQSVRDVLNSTGLPSDRGIAIVLKLRAIGAVLLPGETTAPVAGSARAAAAPVNTPPPSPLRPPLVVDVPTERLPRNLVATAFDAPTMRRAATPAPVAAAEPVVPEARLPNPTADEIAALTEECELSDGDRRRILAMQRLIAGRDPWAMLGVARGADAKTLKRAYFKLSKDIHPDRFYGRQLGSFAERLGTVFDAVSRAYAKLTSPESVRQSGVHRAVGTEQPQTPHEYAAELFDRACAFEVSGEPLEAMKLFAAAVRVDPQTRYLRRAATCAIVAGQPKTAVEYAKKAQAQAPEDPSAARVLASAFRAAGKLSDAEEVLVMAMAMRSSNDSLMLELRNDLAEVRRLLASAL
jgi:hypothetical protein